MERCFGGGMFYIRRVLPENDTSGIFFGLFSSVFNGEVFAYVVKRSSVQGFFKVAINNEATSGCGKKTINSASKA
jgi:hypothetical protein